jgi:DNA replication protein DnaC
MASAVSTSSQHPPHDPLLEKQMQPMPQLEPMLKQLRLSGILDSLVARNQQAIQSKLAYTDFLGLLVQDEVARRDQRQFAQRLRKAQVSGDKTLERFDYGHSPSVNHALIAELGTCRFVTEHAPVLIAGPTGTGKSHLMQAICHCALRAGYDVLFITHMRLLAQLHAAKATNTYDRKLQQLARTDVIAIDDFGLRPMRSPQDEDFHELIAERYEKKPTLVTSNLAFDEWGAAFPNKLMGAATIDRLRDGAYQIELDGDTRRKPRPKPSAPDAADKASNTGSPQAAARQR